RRRVCRSRGAGADAVVHDRGLLELVLELLRQHPCEDLGAAAGRERTDEGDGARRIVLRHGRAGEQTQHEAEQKSSHFLPRVSDRRRPSSAGVMLVKRGGSEVRIILAASPTRRLLNQSHTSFNECQCPSIPKFANQGAAEGCELRTRDTSAACRVKARGRR